MDLVRRHHLWRYQKYGHPQKEIYDAQKSNPEYQKLLKQCPIIGIWDDHDYGVNDGDKNYAKKVESKDLLMDFLACP